MYVCVHVCTRTLGVRRNFHAKWKSGQLVGIISFILPCGFQELNSRLLACGKHLTFCIISPAFYPQFKRQFLLGESKQTLYTALLWC